ncbi:ScbA/BarX family gamma-butyrolactone biosynthesis protein [Streptomyces sp. NPDC007346]|uniref:ScbA/BarX family gamma-butyrolactone biosynthesis protein n=1 Tax=Streptomyces sp. NPDC007346 TaxID=3154682 RepID=UPI00345394BE
MGDCESYLEARIFPLARSVTGSRSAMGGNMSISTAMHQEGPRVLPDPTTTACENSEVGATVPPRRAAPGQLLHRSRPSDVLISDWVRTDTDRFTLALDWPDSHPFHSPLHGRHAPSLIAETIRQAGRLVAHAEFAVPLDHHFLMRDLNYTIEPDRAHAAADGPPLLLDLTCSDIRRRGACLARMTCHMVITRGGQVVATGYGTLTSTSPATYRRLRGDRLTALPSVRLPAPVPPATVRRADPADVVLSPTREPLRWVLRADPANPALFARPNDHVPGMVLLEAVHQAAQAAVGPAGFYPASMRLCFDRYAEFGAPCVIEACPAADGEPGTVCLRVSARQGGQSVFSALITGIAVSA